MEDEDGQRHRERGPNAFVHKAPVRPAGGALSPTGHHLSRALSGTLSGQPPPSTPHCRHLPPPDRPKSKSPARA